MSDEQRQANGNRAAATDERRSAMEGRAATVAASSSAEPSRARPARGAASGIARRDAMISQLERAVAEERSRSERLVKTIEDLRFQMQILEQSYAKQLKDARAQAADGDGQGSAARIAELETANQETMQLLSEAQDEIHRLRSELETLAQSQGARPMWRPGLAAQEKEWYEEGTINALMDDDKWTSRRAKRDEGSASETPAANAAAADPAADDEPGELISPDWAFAIEKSRD